jgi:hypothetical protein
MGRVWTGLIWLRIGTGGGLLWTREWVPGLHKMLGTSSGVERLDASEEGLRSTWLLQLTSWSWALLEKQPVEQLLKNSPTFYGTRRFITVFTRALHCSLTWARGIQSISSHPIYLRSILILSTHLLLGLPSGLFPSRFPTKILHTFLYPSSCYIPCTCHPTLLHHYDVIIIITIIIHK